MTTAEEVEGFLKQQDLRMSCWCYEGQWHCRLYPRSWVYGDDDAADGWDVQRSGDGLLEAQLVACNAYAKLAVYS